jgi:transposase InsO family protein
MVTPAARREAVAHLRVAFEVSERRACSTLCTDRTSVRYRSRRPSDAAARGRLRELALVRRRFGYRRLHILLTREGIVMNHKKLRRLYREERLAVRRRGGRKRALGTRAPMALPQGPPISAGAWISCRTPSPMAGASASWRSSTTSRASAWRWCPTHRSLVCELHVN